MYHELDKYIENLDALIQKLSPVERRRLNQEIGRKIRASNKLRIAANISPSGGAFLSRKGEPLRKLRRSEQITPGKEFKYMGFGARMCTVKTAASAANPSRATTRAYEADYVWGWDDAAGGIRKYKKSRIGIVGGGVKSKLMFRKIHQLKYLKQRADNDRAAVGFLSGLTGHIAAAHQYGEGSRPVRQLLGFSDDDLHMIEETVVRHLSLK